MNTVPTSLRFVRGSRTHQAGHVLVEVVIGMLITALLTVAAFTAHTSMKKKKETTDAATQLQAIDTSIRNFVLRENRLPCPSQAGDGVETMTERLMPDGTLLVQCTTMAAQVPFVTIGMDLPAQSTDRTLRYGVAGQLTLSTPSQPQKLLDHALMVTRLAPRTDVPYVAVRNSEKVFANCDEAVANPAYTLMWLPAAQAEAVPRYCFRQSADQSMGVLAIGGTEFVGWLLGNLRF